MSRIHAMLGTQLIFPTIAGVRASLYSTDQIKCSGRRPISSWHSYSSSRVQFFSYGFLNSRARRCVSCKSSFGSFSPKNGEQSSYEDDHDDNDDYVEAILLISETISHHRMRMDGFKEEIKLQSSVHLGPFSIQSNELRSQVHPVGSDFLRRFGSPTIFLKVSCDGYFVLPIIVGESAVEKLMETFREDDRGDCPNQFQLVRNLMEKFGYEDKMVKITERVANTYFSRIYFHKPGETKILFVDARPSDAINVAKRCKAPIYVNKQIVLADATRISYVPGRTSTKSVYNVSLDSAADGPDLLSEELKILRNMNLAAQEERYSDAALWRDKLMKLRE